MAATVTTDQMFEGVERKFGFVPNLLREMSKSPAALGAYVGLSETLSRGVLTDEERQVVQLAVSAENGCEYCMAAHSAALRMVGSDEGDIAAIVDDKATADDRLNALVKAARLLVGRRGHLDEQDLSGLERQGISRAQLYEVIAIIGLKTISNYINHISGQEIDPQFRGG